MIMDQHTKAEYIVRGIDAHIASLQQLKADYIEDYNAKAKSKKGPLLVLSVADTVKLPAKKSAEKPKPKVLAAMETIQTN